MGLRNLDSFINDVPGYEEALCKCEECDAELFEGDSVIDFNGGYYCDTSCYEEKLVRMNEPDFKTLKPNMV